MKFEEHKRTEYQNNTLFEVVFQARFPQILSISKDEPADFQDIIRKNGFPETRFNAPDIPADIPESIRKIIGGEKEYTFLSEDGDWRTTLTKDFIALSCLNYKNYTEFKDKLKVVLDLFYSKYEPAYFSRIGFRYQNICNASVFKDYQGDIADFVPEHIAPELKLPVGADLQMLEKRMHFADPPSEVEANLQYVYGKISGKFGKLNVNDEKSYIIDIDCFSQRKERDVNSVISRTELFNGHIRNVFQWSITDELRTAMGPKSQ